MAECLISGNLLLYLILGAIAGMIYSLRRIFKLEKTILALDNRIVASLGLRPVKLVSSKPKKKKAKKKVAKRKPKKRKTKKRKR